MGVVGGIAVIGIMVGTVGYLLGAMALGIRRQVRDSASRPWKDFGLSITLAALFLISWVGQAVAQWQEFTDQQASHGETPLLGDFVAAFGSSTLENWQSEFLQLFSFVVLSAVLIHRGSAESKDSDDRMEQALARIEDRLGTAPVTPSPEDVRPDAGPLMPETSDDG